jgi:hypothetical protein
MSTGSAARYLLVMCRARGGVSRVIMLAVLAAPIRELAAGEEPTPSTEEEKTFTWGLRWGGFDEGLQYELRQRVEVGGPERLIPYRIFDERVSLRGKIGGKLAIDGAAFFTTGELSDLDNGVEVRRARLYAMGEIYPLIPVGWWKFLIPIYYKIEISYVGDVGIVVESNYLGVKSVPIVQSVTIGNQQTPFSLELDF